MTVSAVPADAPPSADAGPRSGVNSLAAPSPVQQAGIESRAGLIRYLAHSHQHVAACAILFTIAFGYRIRELDAPLYGDQALYYYLSKTLGFPPDSVRDLGSLWTHFVVRPFMYVFFWPWANLGMTSFRVANIALGAIVPCLCYALSIRFRVRPGLAAVMALAVAIHPVAVSFSGRCFPDNLATALVLAGYLAYFAERVRLAILAMVLTILAKEAFAMFLLPLVADGAYRFVKQKSRLVAAPLIALAVVAATNLLSVHAFGGQLQGWGSGKPNAAFFRGFLASAWFIPLYALLLLEKRLSVLAISLAAPIFFVVWGFVLHRGVEQWYIYGPFCVAVVALSVGLQEALSIVTAGPETRRAPIPRGETWRRFTSRCCALCLLATIMIMPEQAGWRSWLDLVKLEQLLDLHPKIGADHIEQIAQRIKQRQPKDLLVMDSFWAFAYYPFGPSAQHVWQRYTGSETGADAMAELSAVVRKHDYVVTGDSSKDSAQGAQFSKAFGPCLVDSAGTYKLYAVRAQCLDRLTR